MQPINVYSAPVLATIAAHEASLARPASLRATQEISCSPSLLAIRSIFNCTHDVMYAISDTDKRKRLQGQGLRSDASPLDGRS
jgi:hypothetical protein